MLPELLLLPGRMFRCLALLLGLTLLPSCQKETTAQLADDGANASDTTSVQSAKSIDPLYSQGQELFGQHCQRCHDFATSGVGPALDRVRQSRDATFVRESIVEPDRQVLPPFRPGSMPANFAQRLNEAELDALVFFVANGEALP